MTAVIWQPKRARVDADHLVACTESLIYQSREPCSDALLAMLGDVSRAILNDPISRRVPQYVALAFWLRPASLARLKKNILAGSQEGELSVARGVALHLPPTNVDTIFVYSWALSVLAGNANIVRLAENQSSDTEWLVGTIAKTVAEHGDIARQIFCTYPYGGKLERDISAHCDLRMIWGGDQKVNIVSTTPIRPDGLSLGFPDRKSLAIISSQAYAAADDNEKDALADQFYNDLFWFDQMGCGSPRLLIWYGEHVDNSAEFYGRLGQVITKRKFAVDTGVVIGKLTFGHDLLAEGISDRQTVYSNEFSVCRVSDPQNVLSRSQGGGFLCDCFIGDLDEIPPVISRAVQTITHFGLASHELNKLGRGIAGRGGYRIVPIGEALQFDTTWDGIKLFEHMTRKIVIRTNGN